jgi:Tfp pilus assembly protein PilX
MGVDVTKTSDLEQLESERGIALLTGMMLLLIITVLGMAALTVTGFEIRTAGYASSSEAAASATESCVGTAVNVIQQTIDQSKVPVGLGGFVPNPVPSTAMATTLEQEILGRFDNNSDATNTAPNMVQQVGSYVVNGDIDRLYARAKAGGSLQFAAGNEGAGNEGAIDIYYRIDCIATNTATGSTSRITAVYACTKTGESCQRTL